MELNKNFFLIKWNISVSSECPRLRSVLGTILSAPPDVFYMACLNINSQERKRKCGSAV